MNRTLVVALVIAVLCSGAVATAAAFADGDEVVEGSEVYLDAADSDNGEQYVRIGERDEVRLQFDNLPPAVRHASTTSFSSASPATRTATSRQRSDSKARMTASR